MKQYFSLWRHLSAGTCFLVITKDAVVALFCSLLRLHPLVRHEIDYILSRRTVCRGVHVIHPTPCFSCDPSIRVRLGVEFNLFNLQKKMGVMLMFTAPGHDAIVIELGRQVVEFDEGKITEVCAYTRFMG